MEKQEIILNPDQKNAIEADIGSPTIVTAAAGSGKTFVLVERIIRLICNMEEGKKVPADTLAIMTFTKNATSSLHEKLNKALDKELMRDDLSEENRAYLEDQKFKLRQASISTIDAFCLRIIKENPEAFGLPVTFTIADNAKKAAMQMRAITLAMQAFYSDSDADSEHSFTKQERNALFYTFNFENDSALQKKVVSFAEELSTYVDADKWLSEALDVYKDEKSLEKQYLNVFAPTITPLMKRLKTIKNSYPQIISAIQKDGEAYLAEGNADLADATNKTKKGQADNKIKSATKLLDTIIPQMEEYAKEAEARFDRLETLYNAFSANPSIKTLGDLFSVVHSFPEMPKVDGNSGYRAKNSRPKFTAAKDEFQKIIDTLENISFDHNYNDISAQASVVSSFIKLVNLYRDRYDFIKKSSGCIDFSDAELMLLKKLTSDEDFRKQLSERFSCLIVDEFQDSNDIQAEIFKKIADGKLFYVGDIKQSIYAFRGGNPKIMAGLCKGQDGFNPLPLSINYRSRENIVDLVNKVFTGLMTEEYGGVDYYSSDSTKDNSLHFGAESYPAIPEENKDKYCSEIHIINSKPADEDKDFVQARFIAQKIKELHDDENFKITREVVKEVETNGQKVLKKVKELVRPDYSDFLILMRTKDKIPNYRQALAELGIMSSVPKGSNFLESEEIKLVLNYLAIVDNPLKDEELLKVLMSPIYRFSANEVAELRLGLTGINTDDLKDKHKKALSRKLKKYSLFNCLKVCSKSLNLGDYIEGEDKAIERTISPKLSRFLNDLKGFRYYMSSNSLYKLVCKIYEDTDAELIAAAFEDSARRVANIRRLQDMAADFESRDGGSLGDFLRFIERVKLNRSQKVEDASIPEGTSNSVRIMTFHASKGLEAPVCIMTELDHQLSGIDSRGEMINDRDNYFALMNVDIKKRVKSKTFAYCALNQIIKKRTCSEELRLLYVALTRAQDKLIMVAKGDIKKWNETVFDPAAPEEVLSSSTPFKWIYSSLLRYPRTGDDSRFMIEEAHCLVTEDKFDGKPPQTDAAKTEEFNVTEEDISALYEKMNFRYAHEEDTTKREKFSVTELAHRNSTMPINLSSPAFAKDFEKVSGADKGNAYHNCMQYISFDVFRNTAVEDYIDLVKSEIDMLRHQNKLTEKEVGIIEPEKIAAFFSGEFGQRILKCSEIRREEPFFAEVNGADIGEDDLDRFMLQGRIDLYFVEDGEIVVVDYKTDTPHNLAKEKENYAKQVKIYSSILPKITGLKVKEIYLYAFATGEALQIQ